MFLHLLLFIPMHIKNPITKLALSTVLLSTLVACSKEIPSSSTRGGDSERNEVYQTFSLDVPAEEDSLDIQDQTSRAIKLTLTQGTTVPIVPKLNREGIKDSVLTVVTIYNKTKQLAHSASVWWIKQTRKHIQASAYYYMRDIQLPSSMTGNIDKDEWYLIAVAGGGTYSASNQRLPVTGTTNLAPVTVGQKVEWEAPFASPWRRLTWDKLHKKFLLKDNTKVVMFRPQGIYLVLQVENRAALGVNIKRSMRLESNGYASKGYYDFSTASIKKQLNQVGEGKETATRLWVTTNDETAGSRESESFRDKTHRHYVTPFTLNPASGEAGSAIHLNKRKDAGTPTRYKNTYVLWLQKIDPYGDRLATDAANGPDEKNIIYAPAEVDEPGRDIYVERKSLKAYPYNKDPEINRWKPYLGSRYIIGSIPHGVQAGKAHLKTLRIVRPFLPIEFTGAEIFYSAYRDLDGKAPWRRPYVNEISPLLRIPTDFLQRAGQQAPRSGSPSVNLGGDIGIVQYDFNNDPWEVKTEPRIYYNMSWMFSRVPGSDTIYGIGYRNGQVPNGSGGNVMTNNYAVAIRITINRPYNEDPNRGDIARNKWGKNQRENAKIEHYYLGPNFDVGSKPISAVTYVMTPQFWKYCIDEQAIISRVFPFRDINNTYEGVHYWVWHPAGDERSNKVAINNKSEARYQQGGGLRSPQWNQPWLSTPAW